MPQETILFDRARLRRSLAVELAPDASLLALEAIIFGRTAMRETVSTGFFHERWRIRRDGKLLFADDMRFADDIGRMLTRPAVLNGGCAAATLVLAAADAEDRLDTARDAVGDAGGVSAWDGKLLARLVTPDGLSLRRATAALAAVLLAGAELPKVWQL